MIRRSIYPKGHITSLRSDETLWTSQMFYEVRNAAAVETLAVDSSGKLSPGKDAKRINLPLRARLSGLNWIKALARPLCRLTGALV